MPLVKLPGVYGPQDDSDLLASALRRERLPAGARALELGTGTGFLALVALEAGAAHVTAVDRSRRAVWTARLNAQLARRHHRLDVVHGDLLDLLPPPSTPLTAAGTAGTRGTRPAAARPGQAAATAGGRLRRRYDLVLANPPYVPAPDRDATPRRARAWDAGPDGRAVLDRLCAAAPALLGPRGVLLLVHSEIAAPDRTLAQLTEAGLDAGIVARRLVPFGPVLRSRADWLVTRGMVSPGQDAEELVVVRAGRPPEQAA
ncbi:methyltransferase [Streptomyces sp. NPDC059740]|uniref:methyltransferase n=1 Tax=Streptomyces sp. NPDC059740 TaxID=3346926 RepID=UPI003662503A